MPDTESREKRVASWLFRFGTEAGEFMGGLLCFVNGWQSIIFRDGHAIAPFLSEGIEVLSPQGTYLVAYLFMLLGLATAASTAYGFAVHNNFLVRGFFALMVSLANFAVAVIALMSGHSFDVAQRFFYPGIILFVCALVLVLRYSFDQRLQERLRELQWGSAAKGVTKTDGGEYGDAA